jgi:hypothetical protein
MMGERSLACTGCGGREFQIDRVANDEPEDRARDWKSTLSAVCRSCHAQAIMISTWYDHSYEVAAFGKILATNR